MADVAMMARPQRWDSPFDPDMDEAALAMLLARPEFSGIDASRFPPSMPLDAILQNDCRVIKYDAGNIVIREGDYGNSAFLILKGALKAVIPPGFPSEVLGRASMNKRGLWSALSQIWTNLCYRKFATPVAIRSAARIPHTVFSASSVYPFSIQSLPAVSSEKAHR